MTTDATNTEYEIGSVAENDDMSVFVNYSQEAKEKELIKIVPKNGNEVIISADDILQIIATQIKKKDIAVALTTADITEIPMIETMRPLDVTLEKDFKKGDHIQFLFPHMYPYFLAVAEEAYKLCQTRGEIKIITKEAYDEVAETLIEKNKPFIEAMYAEALKNK
jgi:hypothetical protein